MTGLTQRLRQSDSFEHLTASERALIENGRLLLAGEQVPTGGFAVRPDGPPIDPADLARRRFVRTGDDRQLPIYRFDRVRNTNEQSIVAVRTGPML